MNVQGLRCLSKPLLWEVQQEIVSNRGGENSLHSWWCFQTLVVLEDRTKVQVISRCPWVRIPNPSASQNSREADVHRKTDATMACCLLREMPIHVLLAAFHPFPKVVDIGITLKNQNQTNTTKQKLYRRTKVEQHGNICGLRVAHDSNLPRTALFPWKA